MKDEAGFTLLELMITLGILGLGLSFSLVALQQRERVGLKRAALAAEETLRRVAAEARRSGRDRVIDVERDPPRLCPGEGTCLDLPAGVQLAFSAAEEAGSSGSRGRILFLGGGGATGGELRLVRGRDEVVLTVDWLTGRVVRR